MEHEKKNKLKKIGLWMGGITLAILLLGNIATVSYVLATSKIEITQTNIAIQKLNDFRDGSIEANVTQCKINEQLIAQVERLEKRVNRLDKSHKFSPLEWDEIKVPDNK
jgi:hypothetical protein